MSAVHAGALAIFVEGLLSFIMHEPETISRMGIIGKYLGSLFKGWVAIMSAASLALSLLPILCPNTFGRSGSIPAWIVWLGAAFCFVTANFLAWKQEHERANRAELTLRSIALKMDIDVLTALSLMERSDKD